ncbi:hypothetical protein E1I18_01010 [Mycoplasmopsis mucosicanis]|uniref:Rho termination factor N-terminal domain-containing protein n=1 Tax=Mycoplasmopsis mucosicanis TaxID=458208 RepID=A0A507SRY7_9BACT|nr:hypothetical protein [Mycoplasmopsis mucosicanis]TQC54021.1 hypothetical protein E1I18_01010 [Mycoplasmopsis mucosicanis]
MFDFSPNQELNSKILWENEPTKFRKFIIGSTVSSIIISLFYFLNFLLGIIDTFYFEGKSFKDLTGANSFDLFFSILLVGAVIYFSIDWVISVFKSYKNKSFRFLSNNTLIFYGILSFVAVLQLISLFFTKLNNSNQQLNPVRIINLVTQVFLNVLLVVFYYVFFRKTKKIYVLFAQVHQHEEMMKQPEYKQLVESVQDLINNANNAASSSSASQSESQQNQNDEEEAIIVNAAKEKEDKYYKRLLELPNEKLFEIAKKLSISGYETMEKEELARTIITITQNSNKENQ